MGSMIKLTGQDGVTIDAYKAEPTGSPRGGIVILQEIFGVNHHIKRVADAYAAEGYLAIAPALFDRVKPGVELGYTSEGIQEGVALQKQTQPADTLEDVEAAVEAAAAGGKVGVVGYCWGGTLAFLAACNLTDVAAAVGYYGGGIASMLEQKPKVPLMLHFGEHDDHIPMSAVEKIRSALPEVPVYSYPAGHGFNCDERGSFHAESAELALSRTLPFLKANVG